MKPCVWIEDDCGCYEALCNKKGFCFNDGGVKDNGFHFCPYCGAPLVEIRYEEGADDEE